ncbi:hypothetical protein EDC22_102360 [Tepidamorphus gemmatus]|uniref:Uncharacterized protein n=1 Tax=Tepidamorphus gemmatus TaxID=747076 RepID=A0A4R3MG11_9HYPH|nr:hypothetical protein EDC22_102360 [Tepidamorphus gemmatus]
MTYMKFAKTALSSGVDIFKNELSLDEFALVWRETMFPHLFITTSKRPALSLSRAKSSCC